MSYQQTNKAKESCCDCYVVPWRLELDVGGEGVEDNTALKACRSKRRQYSQILHGGIT